MDFFQLPMLTATEAWIARLVPCVCLHSKGKWLEISRN